MKHRLGTVLGEVIQLAKTAGASEMGAKVARDFDLENADEFDKSAEENNTALKLKIRTLAQVLTELGYRPDDVAQETRP